MNERPIYVTTTNIQTVRIATPTVTLAELSLAEAVDTAKALLLCVKLYNPYLDEGPRVLINPVNNDKIMISIAAPDSVAIFDGREIEHIIKCLREAQVHVLPPASAARN